MQKSRTADLIFEGWNGSNFVLLIVDIMKIKEIYFRKINAKYLVLVTVTGSPELRVLGSFLTPLKPLRGPHMDLGAQIWAF